MKYLHEKAIERTPELLRDILLFLETCDDSLKKSKLKSKILRQIDVLENKYIN